MIDWYEKNIMHVIYLPNWFGTGGLRTTSGPFDENSCQRYVLRYSEWSCKISKKITRLKWI